MSNNSPQTASQACAACKYQRRRCAPSCTLAPYFPPERTNDFLNAHKLFGISKITKALVKVSPLARQNTIKCMVFEANVRSNDKVGGCYRIVCELQRRINYAEAELDLVLRQLATAKAQHGVGNLSPNPNPNPSLRFSNEVQNQNHNQHPRVGVGGAGVGLGLYGMELEKINDLGVEGIEYPVLPIRGLKANGDPWEASCSYANQHEESEDKKPGSG
ncbi:hypothetical protein LguiB_028037 [Lonicera macranthoides]